ncbi:toxin glutamine deamidase domain-containing protein [Streptomyces panaciradicis]|uniref:toxin glutamine deamidase domain-containing protein n=1 Tax=Streptomyces panaciradicis TaxID=1470261 RepID=UPI00201CCEBB|nr:toxin glutamine deamidase domain-containing protein [Streptomyces panaciradicis]MCL6672703.1 toxin glutamine deamidase domain-containing protein [Streptomyces panaciradicis]
MHTPIRTPAAAAAPHHAAGPATPHAPGSPQATPGDTTSPNHPNQDSLQDIRSDLDHYPGGLTDPDPSDQQALADAVPRNEDGTPQRYPDPFDGNWSQLQNDGGVNVPGRSNNCADCSRSFLETWYGNPQVSAPRTLDTDANGKPDLWSPEDNANDNQIRWTGAAHTYAGPGGDPNTANNIANTLQQAGPGSAAIVQVDWPGGGGHAFNVVNHNGKIVWIDTQSGQVSTQPLHIDQATHVWHIPLDANRNPIDTSQPHGQGTDQSGQGTDGSQQSADTSQTASPSQTTNESQDGTEVSPQSTTDVTDTSQGKSNAPGETPDASPAQDSSSGVSHADPTQPDTSGADSPVDSGPETKRGDDQDSLPAQDKVSPPDNDTRTEGSAPVTSDTGDAGSSRDGESSPTHLSEDSAATPPGHDTAPSTSHTAPNDSPGDHRAAEHAQRSTTDQATSTDHRHGPEAPAAGNEKNKGEGDKKDSQENDNQPKKPKKTPAERAAELARARRIANTPLDSSGPEGHPGYGVVQDGDQSSVHHNMLGDESQDLLRVTNQVVQTDLHGIAQHLHRWAEGNPSPLLQTIREASESGRLTQDRLNALLRPGFEEMSRENKAATVAAIARLSSAFHDAHAVDDSGGADLHSRHKPTRGDHLDPAPLARRYAATRNLADHDAQALAESGEALSEGDSPQKTEKEISRERLKFNKLWNQHVGDAQLNRAIAQAESEGRPQEEIDAMREHRRMMRPDFSGKNFAALEIIDHRPDGTTEIHYIIDSSNPPLDHSEPVLGEAYRRLDQEDPGRYEAPIMYTEFEPCGNRTYPANANCADYIAHELERPADQELKKYHEKTEEERAAIPEAANRTKVVYGAGYRLGDLSPDEVARIESLPPDERQAETERVRQEAVDARNADMHRFRGELARVWMKLAAGVDVP